MRKAREARFVFNDDTLLGINFGADFVAEHEWGIDGLKRIFGVDANKDSWFSFLRPKVGIERRTATKVPSAEDMYFSENGQHAMLIVSSHLKWMKLNEGFIPDDLKCVPMDDPVGAWDEKSFGVRVISKKYTNYLKEIHEAILKKDIVIWVGRNDILDAGGLSLVIASRIPKEKLISLEKTDKDYINLLNAAKDTKIEKKLKDAGKKWFALSPRWATHEWRKKTKYPVIFWLNPYDQANNNFGWFTVEELTDWIDDKGPVPVSREQQAERDGYNLGKGYKARKGRDGTYHVARD